VVRTPAVYGRSDKMEQLGRSTVSVEEVVLSNSYSLAALLELLEEKGILTQTEVLERVTLIRARGKPQ